VNILRQDKQPVGILNIRWAVLIFFSRLNTLQEDWIYVEHCEHSAGKHPVGILEVLCAVSTFYWFYILFFSAAHDVCMSPPILFTIPVTSILSTFSRGFTHSLLRKAAKTCKSTSLYWWLIYRAPTTPAPCHDMTSHGVYVASERSLSGYCLTWAVTFMKFRR
jgi:hypothetical protein